MKPPWLFGKMKSEAPGEVVRLLHSSSSAANLFGNGTYASLSSVLAHGRSLPLYTASATRRACRLFGSFSRLRQRKANNSPGRTAVPEPTFDGQLVPKRSRGIDHELVLRPFEDSFVRLPSLRPLQLAARILRENVLVNRFAAHGFQVRAAMKHHRPRVLGRKLIDPALQFDPVQFPERLV